MDKSYWQQEKMNERRKRLVKETGDGLHDSAKQILSTSLESLARAIAGDSLSEPDKITLDYLRTSLHDHLIEGMSLDRAFGIENEKGGRPKISEQRKQEIFGLVSNEKAKLIQAGVNNPIQIAQKNVATKEGISQRAVREIWQNESHKRLKRNTK